MKDELLQSYRQDLRESYKLYETVKHPYAKWRVWCVIESLLSSITKRRNRNKNK